MNQFDRLISGGHQHATRAFPEEITVGNVTRTGTATASVHAPVFSEQGTQDAEEITFTLTDEDVTALGLRYGTQATIRGRQMRCVHIGDGRLLQDVKFTRAL